VRSSVLLAVDNVKESSATLVETVKEKSSTISVASISDSIVENAALVKAKSFEVAGMYTLGEWRGCNIIL
jgi:hypothetical protein